MLAKPFSDIGNCLLPPIDTFIGPFGAEVMSILVLTSAFAAA